MATFEQYQNHLRGLGTETANIRREMAISASGSPALEAEYNRIITEIDATVAAIRAEHPARCWQEDDPEYRLLKAQWALDRAEMARREKLAVAA